MISGGFYEEVIHFKDFKVNLFFNFQDEKDSNEFYINEELTELEKINFILKKGTVIQKEAVN
jgi:hypothetical protein